MTQPRVNPTRKNPFDNRKDDVLKQARADASKSKQSTAMAMQSKIAQQASRHTAEEYAPTQQNWSQGVIDSPIYLDQNLVSDEQIRDKIGLPSNIDLDMLRADPNLWAMFPVAQQRLQQHEKEVITGTSAEAEDNKNWAMKGLGWVKDGLLETGIKVGEAYELLWKPADMLNEKLEHWFPEDATGVRRYLGNALASTPLGIAGAQEGFQPRLPTPKQIQGLIQDSMADLNIGDNEQNERYKTRIDELKAEGMSDDEARLQAFEERTDIPGWVKFALPVVADPLTWVGMPGLVKSVGRGSARVAKGLKEGLKAPISGRDLVIQGGKGVQKKAVMPKAPISDDIVKEASEGGGKLIPKRLIKMFDPSGELKHLADGSVRKLLVGAHIVGKHLQEFADQSGGFMRNQAEGHFGKLDDLWGKSVLDDDQGVFVRRLQPKEYNPLEVGGASDEISDGVRIRKESDFEYADDLDDLDDFYDSIDEAFESSMEEGSAYASDVERGLRPKMVAHEYRIFDDVAGEEWRVVAESDYAIPRDRFGRFIKGGRKGVSIDIRRIPGDADFARGAFSATDPAGLSKFSPIQMSKMGEIIARDFPGSDFFHGIRVTEGRTAARVGKEQFIPVSRFTGSKARPAMVPGQHVERIPLSDVIEFANKYDLSPDQRAFANYMGNMFEEFADIAKVEGINLKTWGTLGEAIHFMARATKGYKDANGVQLIKEVQHSSGGVSKASFGKKRAFEEMQQGLEEGWLYENVYDVIEIYTRGFYRAVANERMVKHLEPVMRSKKVSDNFPGYAAQRKGVQSMMDSQNNFMRELDSFINHEGARFDPSVINSMKQAFKVAADDTSEIAALKNSIIDDIDKVLAPRFDTWKKAAQKMSEEGFAIPGVNAAKLIKTIEDHRKAIGAARPRQNIGVGELRQAIKKLNISRAEERRVMEEFMKKAGDEIRMTRKGELGELRAKMGQITPETEGAWKKIQAEGVRLAEKSADVNIRTEAQSSVFPNRIFTSQLGNDARGAALMFDKAFQEDAGAFLRFGGNVNAAMRQFKTTWDLGAPLIQGLPILFTDAAAWGKSTGMMVRGLKDPAVRARYVADNAEKIADYMQYGMHLGSSEMTEAAARGGWLAKLPRVLESGASRVGIGEETTHQTARRMATAAPKAIGWTNRRFQTAFDTYLDVARIEVMKGLEATAMSSANPHKAMAELAQFTNKLTGVTSTKAMGVSATQRGIESSILMFSPRYTRATAALFMDISRGGLRGDRARKAIASLFAGQLALHAAAAAALDQEVNFIPGHAQFMKVQVGDSWIGFGGKGNSLMNMGADVTQQLIDKGPQSFMDLKVWNQETYNSNSILKRLRYQMAPGAGEAMSWITGADAIGRTLPDDEDLMSDPEEFLKYVGPKFLPFGIEAAIEGGPLAGMAEFTGSVANPVLPYVRRDELREKYVKERFGKDFPGIDWDKFKKLPTYRSKYALMLEEYPDLKAIEELVEKESKNYFSSKERVMYQDKSSDIRREQIHGVKDESGKLVEQGYDQISDEFWSGANGRQAGEVFRRKMTIIGEAGSARRRDLREKHPKLIEDRNEYYQGAALENLATAARNELFDFMSSPRAKDAFGNVNHQAIENFKGQIETRYEQYGEGMGKKIADEIRFSNDQQLLETPDGSSLPPLITEYYKSWDVLRPFWDSYKDVLPPGDNEENWKAWQLFSNSPEAQKNSLRLNPKYRSLERIVENKRNQMRRLNYDIDKYLTMFFDYSPMNPKRQSEIRRQASKLRTQRP